MSHINKSTLTDHVTTKNHIMDWGKQTFLIETRKKGQIKEAIWIRKTKTPINKDEGNYELPHVYDDIISTEGVQRVSSNDSLPWSQNIDWQCQL